MADSYCTDAKPAAMQNCAAGTSCGTNMVCDSSGSCVPACTNECTTAEAKQCSGNGYQTCGNYDADSCLEWSAVTACPTGQVCSNDQCVAPVSDFSISSTVSARINTINPNYPVPNQALYNSIDLNIYKKCVWDTTLIETGTDGPISITERKLDWIVTSGGCTAYCSGTQTKTAAQIQTDLGFSTTIPQDGSINWYNEWAYLDKGFTWSITETIKDSSGKIKTKTFPC